MKVLRATKGGVRVKVGKTSFDLGISQYYPYTIPNKDPHNPHIIPIYFLGSLGYPLFGKPPL